MENFTFKSRTFHSRYSPIICVLAFLLLLPSTVFSAIVQIIKSGTTWQLLVDNDPYFIKGAGGSSDLDLLVQRGGNSIRRWSPDGAALDNAQQRGLTVCIGISTDETTARTQVEQYKDHPALLMWAIGNEEETRTDDAVALWQRVNRIAQMIGQVDGNHPAITVIAEIGGDKLNQLQQYAPDLDAVGINTYGSILSLGDRISQTSWDRPYFVTEFGPRGHWEVSKEEWGVPIEQSSTEKEAHYLLAYRNSIEGRSLCLGSYVFLWGHKQEKTHTWYGMFLPGDLGGNPLNPVDAMTLAWTGSAAQNQCPDIGPGKIKIGPQWAPGDGSMRYFPPGLNIKVEVDADDPDGDSVNVEWDLRYDLTDNTASGGAHEPSSEPIAGAVISSTGKSAIIKLPNETDNFRIHCYVYDNQGNAATVNQGIVVDPQYVMNEPDSSVPSITLHPASVSAQEAGSATFSVEADGFPLSYQWIKNGVDLPGENEQSLVINNIDTVDNGATFSVRVFNGLGSDISEEALLSVLPYAGPVSVFTSISPVPYEFWQSQQFYNIENSIIGTASSEADISGMFATMWDSGNFYVFIDIKDDVLSDGGEANWQNDGAEVYIDFDNNKQISYDTNDFQFQLPWNGIVREMNGRIDGVQMKQTSTDAGYSVEIQIPWVTLGGGEVNKGKILGVDIHIIDNDGSGRECKLAWNATQDNAYQNPSVFGSVKLHKDELATGKKWWQQSSAQENVTIKEYHSYLAISLAAPVTGKVSLSLINAQGRIVLHRDISLRGNQTITVDKKALVPGVYFLSVSSGKWNTVKPMCVTEKK